MNKTKDMKTCPNCGGHMFGEYAREDTYQHGYKETPDELKPSVLAVAKLEGKLKKRNFL